MLSNGGEGGVETTYHHSTLTYELSSVSNFWHMKQCLRRLVLLIRRIVLTVKRRASTPRFDLHGHVRVQILTHEPMSVCSSEHNLTHAKDCDVYSLRKTSLCAIFYLHGRVRMQIFSWEDVSVYNMSHNFLRFGSTDMFSTQCVEYKTCSCACSHTKRPWSDHFSS